MYEYKVIDKLLNALNLYKRVGIYGAGISSKKIYSVIEKMKLLDKVECFIDQDSSPTIGTFIGTKEVKKIDQVINNIDVIIVSSIKYWKPIQNRLKKYLQEISCDKEIVSIFDDDKKESREYKKPENCNNYQEINLNSYIREEEDPLLIAWYYSNQVQKNKNIKYPAYDYNNISSNVPQYFINQPDLMKPIDESILYHISMDELKHQVNLAKFYGIYGFCFPIFWKEYENLEYAVEKFIEAKDIDFKFCFCITDYILLKRISDRRFRQYEDANNSFENIEEFVEMISKALNDERYICIKGRPLILLGSEYMLAQGEMEHYIRRLRDKIVEKGFCNPYFLMGITNDNNLTKFEVDGMFEYPPIDINSVSIKEDIEIINDDFQGHVYDMNKYVNHLLVSEDLSNRYLYKTVSVGYNDLLESKGFCSDILYGMTPSLYEKWLSKAIAESKKVHKRNNFIFIYAWNAWNKSAALEPNTKEGYAYLQSTINAIYDNRKLKDDIVERNIKKFRELNKKLIFYVFCVESMGDIIACEPISRYLKMTYPDFELHWIVKDIFSDLVQYNEYIDKVEKVKNLSEGIDLCDRVKKENAGIVIDCHYNNRICSCDKWHINNNNPQINENTYLNYGSLLESFCLIAGMKPIDIAPYFHESGDRVSPLLGEEYVVFHCTSSEIIKDWDDRKWNVLAEHLFEKHIKVVEIGFNPVIVSKNPLYCDYTMKRDLQEIALIIKGAKGFVGIDSGFAHFANCYCKEAVLIFGKYKNFMYPMPYSGYFKENKKEIIIYPEEGKPAYFVEEEKVYEKCKRFLDK